MSEKNLDKSKPRPSKKIPAEVILHGEQAEQVMQVALAMQKTHFSGPLPPPEYAKEYEEILPGSFDKIIKMAEERLVIEKLKVQNQHAQDFRAFFASLYSYTIGVVVLLALVATAVWCALHQLDTLANWIGGTILASVAIRMFLPIKEWLRTKNRIR
jgi:uncharacterized membrane protein